MSNADSRFSMFLEPVQSSNEDRNNTSSKLGPVRNLPKSQFLTSFSFSIHPISQSPLEILIYACSTFQTILMWPWQVPLSSAYAPKGYFIAPLIRGNTIKSMLRMYLYRRRFTQGTVDPRWSNASRGKLVHAEHKSDNWFPFTLQCVVI